MKTKKILLLLTLSGFTCLCLTNGFLRADATRLSEESHGAIELAIENVNEIDLTYAIKRHNIKRTPTKSI